MDVHRNKIEKLLIRERYKARPKALMWLSFVSCVQIALLGRHGGYSTSPSHT